MVQNRHCIGDMKKKVRFQELEELGVLGGPGVPSGPNPVLTPQLPHAPGSSVSHLEGSAQKCPATSLPSSAPVLGRLPRDYLPSTQGRTHLCEDRQTLRGRGREGGPSRMGSKTGTPGRTRELFRELRSQGRPLERERERGQKAGRRAPAGEGQEERKQNAGAGSAGPQSSDQGGWGPAGGTLC